MFAAIEPTPEPNIPDHEGMLPPDVHFTEYRGHVLCTFVTEDGTPMLHEVTGETWSPRAMLLADAVVSSGMYGRVYYEDEMVIVQHPRAGVLNRLHVTEMAHRPVLTLKKHPPQ